MAAHRIFKTSLASVYPLYVAKAEKKGRRRGEVDEIICWLTGFAIGAATSWAGWQAGKRAVAAVQAAPQPA